MRDRYKIVHEEGIHFLTSTIVEWLPVFTKKVYFDIIIDSLNYCVQNKGLRLYAYVILENHLHLIASAEALSPALTSLRKFTARNIVDQLEQDGVSWLLNQLAYYKKRYKTNSDYQIWQEGMHPKLIQSEQMMRQKIKYIHSNPVRRGYVARPEDWVYSSARNYILEDDSVIAVCRDWAW